MNAIQPLDAIVREQNNWVWYFQPNLIAYNVPKKGTFE